MVRDEHKRLFNAAKKNNRQDDWNSVETGSGHPGHIFSGTHFLRV